VPRSILRPKVAFSTPFRGVLPPFGQQIRAPMRKGRPTLWYPRNLETGARLPGSPLAQPQRGGSRTVTAAPFPGGSCLRLTTELAKMERGPIAMSGPVLSV
jgi:hypothetical protein